MLSKGQNTKLGNNKASIPTLLIPCYPKLALFITPLQGGLVLIWPQWRSRRSAALGWGQISLTDNTDPSLRAAGGASAAKWSGNGRWPGGGRGDHITGVPPPLQQLVITCTGLSSMIRTPNWWWFSLWIIVLCIFINFMADEFNTLQLWVYLWGLQYGNIWKGRHWECWRA